MGPKCSLWMFITGLFRLGWGGNTSFKCQNFKMCHHHGIMHVQQIADYRFFYRLIFSFGFIYLQTKFRCNFIIQLLDPSPPTLLNSIWILFTNSFHISDFNKIMFIMNLQSLSMRKMKTPEMVLCFSSSLVRYCFAIYSSLICCWINF